MTYYDYFFKCSGPDLKSLMNRIWPSGPSLPIPDLPAPFSPPQLELKKTLLDRMVHLLSRGYVLPVVGYIRKCLEKLNTDISLIRYFVTEVKYICIYILKSCFPSPGPKEPQRRLNV